MRTCFSAILILLMLSSFAYADGGNPFKSVKIVGEKIEVVLPEQGPRWVVTTSKGTRLSSSNEAFYLADGEELQLVEKHIHYSFVGAVTGQNKGLNVKYEFNRKSLSAEPVLESYFISVN